ncbi:MAG: OsmC family protein [Ancrocorticia sp.]|jgi:uncharacterized OsmC-like protein|nr:OsmC family protein [Ancrocorticia sp.]MCI2001745.1 OsmC family protein [Ancrocorticia sp.]MCI2013057.1 OsmC family protein [Ancrocorticia sp.]MCI2029580.1 OsmC family protein [Ancrocorticia sp.]
MSENAAEKPDVRVVRTGHRTYHAENAAGATLEIGHGPGLWSPGDLLKAALIGCNALSAEARLEHGLGENFEMTGRVASTYLKDENRISELDVELVPKFGDMTPEMETELRKKALAAIERYCTIGRTLDHGIVRGAAIVRED